MPNEASPGVVVVATEAVSYGTDEPALLHMIERPATPASAVGELSMPKSTFGLYVPPRDAGAVADLRLQKGPPVERFARTEEGQPEPSFFSRLFASLVE